MEKKEKVNYILEQVRLCIQSNDFIRALILSRKINMNVINQDDYQAEKLIYHELMILLYKNDASIQLTFSARKPMCYAKTLFAISWLSPNSRSSTCSNPRLPTAAFSPNLFNEKSST